MQQKGLHYKSISIRKSLISNGILPDLFEQIVNNGFDTATIVSGIKGSIARNLLEIIIKEQVAMQKTSGLICLVRHLFNDVRKIS